MRPAESAPAYAAVVDPPDRSTMTSPVPTPRFAPDIPPPPRADIHPKTMTVHGDTRVDNYAWLRDKSNPDAMAYLHAEDQYADAMMKPTAPLQHALYDEILSHIKQTDDTVPYREGAYFYYTRTREGQQYPIHCRTHDALTASEEVLLDQNTLATGQPFFAIGAFAVSDDGQLLAYTVDTTGYRQFTLQVKDLGTGQLLAEQIERVTDVVWATDSRTLFFVTEDAVTKRSDACFRHVVGTDTTDLVYQEPDEMFDLAAARTRDKAFILIHATSKTSTETRYLPAAVPAAPLRVVFAREPNHEYDVDHRDGVFYIRTNKHATNFRIVTAPVADASEAHWQELVAHRPSVKIDSLDLFAHHLVLAEWEDGLQQIEIRDLATQTSHRIAFPEPVYTVTIGPNREFGAAVVRYIYQSLITPPSVFDYDMSAKQATLLKQTAVPGGFDRTHYVSERVWATATDGTRVPISLVYRRTTTRDGNAPLVLYAYGSYGLSIPPTFAASRLPLLDRGVIYAIAHIRGGGELGEPWREQGRMLKKLNTFTDFIACAAYLTAQHYTSRDRLVIQGGSAGGLLMGAVANMRPELFKAVIAQVPFVDVLTTMLDPSLPLTTSEYIEWGNPNDKAAYDYMQQYSPYDNVTAQAYPAMLVKVSIHDSQVPYWEGAKLVAKLRAMKTDDHPLLLKVNFGAGHGGASGRYDALREIAFNWAFLLSQVGRLGSVPVPTPSAAPATDSASTRATPESSSR
jgi:oligopeptidase B